MILLLRLMRRWWSDLFGVPSDCNGFDIEGHVVACCEDKDGCTLQDPRGNHVVITIVTALAAASEESALSAVQLLWINLIMDTFAALAFATDQATEALLDRWPDRHLRAQEVENKDNDPRAGFDIKTICRSMGK
ncbi:hypothetical protein V8E52_004087 [Russula decolorans]